MSPRGTPNQARPTIRAMLDARGWAVRDLRKHAHIGYAFAAKMLQGKFPPNHPALPNIARLLGVSLADLQNEAREAPMAENQVRRLTSRAGVARKGGRTRTRHERHDEGDEDEGGELLGSIEVSPGRDVPLNTQLNTRGQPYQRGAWARKSTHRHNQKQQFDPARLLTSGNRNGNGVAHVAKRGYNKLRKQDHTLRQHTRTLIMNLNVAAMSGETILPGIPTEVLQTVIQDYLQRLGITATMLVDPEFASHFDHT